MPEWRSTSIDSGSRN